MPLPLRTLLIPMPVITEPYFLLIKDGRIEIVHNDAHFRHGAIGGSLKFVQDMIDIFNIFEFLLAILCEIYED